MKHTRIPLIAAGVLLISLLTILICKEGLARQTGGTAHTPLTSETALSPHAPLSDVREEVRGLWIATAWNINFPSQPGLTEEKLRAELDNILAEAETLSVNTLFFQVRPACDALYDSALFPVSAVIGNTLPHGFDPLAYLTEAAHERNIRVYAWINPLRVSSAVTEVSDLPDDSPARLHPEWTVAYGGGLYFDAGLPAVRDYVARGVEEVVASYAVDGVVFDDYFYPYPSGTEAFDDAASYAAYGAAFADIGDFRRESVNQLVKACYTAVKQTRPACEFGVAPFGIWQNDDGQNGGSETNGLSSYSAIYCDTLAWLAGGYMDFIAPQLYWSGDSRAAPFDTLADWWNRVMTAYPQIDLYISHAAYRCTEYGTAGTTEMTRQIEYCRELKTYAGSILYGYQAIADNECALVSQLQTAFAGEILYTAYEPTGAGVSLTLPTDWRTGEGRIVTGTCDPAYPLYYENAPLSIGKDGSFRVYLIPVKGKNTFVFTQNGVEYRFEAVTKAS